MGEEGSVRVWGQFELELPVAPVNEVVLPRRAARRPSLHLIERSGYWIPVHDNAELTNPGTFKPALDAPSRLHHHNVGHGYFSGEG